MTGADFLMEVLAGLLLVGLLVGLLWLLFRWLGSMPG